MYAEIIKALGPLPSGKPAREITESEKLALYVAAGFPIETDSKVGPKGEYIVTTRSVWPFDVQDMGDRYVIAIQASP